MAKLIVLILFEGTFLTLLVLLIIKTIKVKKIEEQLEEQRNYEKVEKLRTVVAKRMSYRKYSSEEHFYDDICLKYESGKWVAYHTFPIPKREFYDFLDAGKHIIRHLLLEDGENAVSEAITELEEMLGDEDE